MQTEAEVGGQLREGRYCRGKRRMPELLKGGSRCG